MNLLFKIIKKLVFSFLLIYSFNLLYGTFKINIPMNICTVLITTLLGFPGFCGIILISKLLF